VEPNTVVVVRCIGRLPAPPRVLPPPVAAMPPAPPRVNPPALVDRVDEPSPTTLFKDQTYPQAMITSRNFRSHRYAASIVSAKVGNREDLAFQSGVPENILTCPNMEDDDFHHVKPIHEGLELGVIPIHSKALH
jgi:hypothetical protein